MKLTMVIVNYNGSLVTVLLMVIMMLTIVMIIVHMVISYL